jgi:hypothetical protein
MGLLAAGCDNPPSRSGAMPPSTTASAAPSQPQESPTPSARPRPTGSDTASGKFTRVAAGGTDIAGTAGTLQTYCVRVEDGVVSFEPDEVAGVVDAALADSRSWIASKKWRFQRVPGCESAKLRVNLAMPATVDRLCAPAARTVGRWSCYNNRAVHLNLDRWKSGVAHIQDLDAYRVMVVNHEVGHFLGHSHVACPGTGRAAPVMVPQSREMGGCVFNPYPYPDGMRYLG